MLTLFLLVALFLFLSAAMAAVWTVARRPGKEGWTDAVWSYATGAAAAAGALLATGDAPAPRQLLLAAMAALWGLRLGTHIAARNRKDAADPRYAALKKEWGEEADRKLFGFLQAQAICGWVLAASVTLAAMAPTAAWTAADVAGAALFALALGGETLADAQMAAFRRDPGNKGKIMDRGLWGLSRHPNYFFEWLGWCAYPLIAIGSAPGWAWAYATLAAPAMMYWLLVHASGIPPLEKAMLASRGEAWRDYQRRVRAFFPLPR